MINVIIALPHAREYPTSGYSEASSGRQPPPIEAFSFQGRLGIPEAQARQAYLVSCAQLLNDEIFTDGAGEVTPLPQSSKGASLIRTGDMVLKFAFTKPDRFAKYIDNLPQLVMGAGAIHASSYGVMRTHSGPPVSFLRQEYIPGITGADFLRQYPSDRDAFEETVGEMLAGVHTVHASGNEQFYTERKRPYRVTHGAGWKVTCYEAGSGKFHDRQVYDRWPQGFLLEEELCKLLAPRHGEVRVDSLGNALETIKKLAVHRQWTAVLGLPHGRVLNHSDAKPENFLVCTAEAWDAVKGRFRTTGHRKEIGGRPYVFFSLDYDFARAYPSLFGELGALVPLRPTETEQKQTIVNVVTGSGMRCAEAYRDILHDIALAVRVETLAQHARYAHATDDTERRDIYLDMIAGLHATYPDMPERFAEILHSFLWLW